LKRKYQEIIYSIKHTNINFITLKPKDAKIAKEFNAIEARNCVSKMKFIYWAFLVILSINLIRLLAS
jgi:hypothetical protein